jgi:hypothetical protein
VRPHDLWERRRTVTKPGNGVSGGADVGIIQPTFKVSEDRNLHFTGHVVFPKNRPPTLRGQPNPSNADRRSHGYLDVESPFREVARFGAPPVALTGDDAMGVNVPSIVRRLLGTPMLKSCLEREQNETPSALWATASKRWTHRRSQGADGHGYSSATRPAERSHR